MYELYWIDSDGKLRYRGRYSSRPDMFDAVDTIIEDYSDSGFHPVILYVSEGYLIQYEYLPDIGREVRDGKW